MGCYIWYSKGTGRGHSQSPYCCRMVRCFAVLSKITYALPAFAGQLTVDDRNRISAISRKTLRRGVILLLILRKSLTILIANFPSRLPTPVVVYTIYSLLKPLSTVLTVLGKENTITSCLILHSRCTKTVLSIDACLSLDDNLCVLYYF